MRSKGSRRLPALSKAARRLEIERLPKEAPVGLSSVISRSEHWNVPKGRFSAEQGEPQASSRTEGVSLVPVGVRTAPPRCAAASAGTAALARCARQRPGLRPGTRRRTEGALGSVLCPRGCGGPAGPPHRPRRPQADRNQRGVSVRSKGSRRLPALSKAARRLEIVRLTKKAPVGLFSPISRSKHWNVPKGRFSAEPPPRYSGCTSGRA